MKKHDNLSTSSINDNNNFGFSPLDSKTSMLLTTQLDIQPSQRMSEVYKRDLTEINGHQLLLDDTRSKQAKLIRQIEILTKDNRRLELQLQTAQSQILEDKYSYEGEIHKLKTELDETKAQLKKLKQDSAMVYSNNKKLTEQLEMDRMDSLRKQEIIDELNTQMKSKIVYNKPERFPETKIHLLEEQNKKLKATIAALRKNSAIQSAEIKSQVSANKELSNQLVDVMVNSDIDSTDVSIYKFSSDPNYSAEITKLNEANIKKTDQIHKLKREIKNLKEELAQQKQREHALQEMIEVTTLESSKKDKKIEECLKQITEFEIKLTASSNQSEQTSPIKIDYSAPENNDFKVENHVHDNYTSQLVQQVEEYKNLVANLQIKISGLIEENTEIKERLRISKTYNQSDSGSLSNSGIGIDLVEQEIVQKTKEISEAKMFINKLEDMLGKSRSNEEMLSKRLKEENLHFTEAQRVLKENLMEAQDNIKQMKLQLNSYIAQIENQKRIIQTAKGNAQIFTEEVINAFGIKSLTLDDELTQLSTLGKFIKQTHENLCSKINRLEMESKDLQEQLDQSNNEKRNMSMNLSMLEEQAKSKLNESTMQFNKSESMLREELLTTKQELAALDEKFKSSKAIFKDKQNESQKTIESLTNEKSVYKRKVMELNEELEQFKTRQSDFTSTIDQMELTYKNKEKQLTDTINKLNLENSDMRASAEKLRSKILNLENTIEDLNYKQRETEQSKNELLEETNALRTTIEHQSEVAKGTIARNEQLISKLEKANKDLEKEADDLKNQIKILRDSMEYDHSQNAELVNRSAEKIQKLKTKLRQLQEAYVELQSLKDDADKEKVELKLQVTKQQDSVKRAEEAATKEKSAKEANDYVFKQLTKKHQDLMKSYQDSLQIIEVSKQNMAEMTKKLQESERKQNILTKELETQKTKFEDLQAEVDLRETKFLQLQSTIIEDSKASNDVKLENQKLLLIIENLKSEMEKVKDEFSTFKDKTETQRKDLIEISKYNELNSVVEDRKKEIDKLNNKTKDLQLSNKDLKKSVIELTQMLSILKKANNKNAEKIKSLTAAKDELQDEMHANTAEDKERVDRLHEKIKDQKDIINLLEGEAKKTQELHAHEYAMLNKERRDLAIKNEELNAEVAKHVTSSIENQKLLNTLEDLNKDLRNQMNDIKKKYDESVRLNLELEQQQQSIKDSAIIEVSSYKKSLRELTEEKQRLIDFIKEKELQIDDMKTQMNNMTSIDDYRRLVEKYEKFKKKKHIEALKAHSQSAAMFNERERTRLEFFNRENDLLKEISDLKSERDKKGEQVRKLQNQVNALNTHLRSLQEINDTSRPLKEFEAIQHKLTVVETELAGKELEVKDKDVEIQRLMKELQLRDEELNELKTEIREKISEMDRKALNNRELGDRIDCLKEELDNKKKELENNKKELDNKEKELSLSKRTIETLNEKMKEVNASTDATFAEMIPKTKKLNLLSRKIEKLHSAVNNSGYETSHPRQKLKVLQEALGDVFSELNMTKPNVVSKLPNLTKERPSSFTILADPSKQNHSEKVICNHILSELVTITGTTKRSDNLEKMLQQIRDSIRRMKDMIDERDKKIQEMSDIVSSQHSAIVKINRDIIDQSYVDQSISNVQKAKEIESKLTSPRSTRVNMTLGLSTSRIPHLSNGINLTDNIYD